MEKKEQRFYQHITTMQKDTTSPKDINRRQFMKSASTLGAGLMVVPSYVVGQSATELPPSQRINVAFVGVGGKGLSAIQALENENVVALCDVQLGLENLSNFHRKPSKEAAEAVTRVTSKGVPWFQDYREMLVTMGDKIDAVVISIPDHMHYPVAMSAINHGKHVYAEKPLSHTVGEARAMAEAAAKAGVITAMGNQGHSNSGTRSVREWVQAGLIGPIREVHSWTNRPVWPQGHGCPDFSNGYPEVPAGFDWKLWLGVAEDRPWHPDYAPFNWRGYFDFGSGAFGDMACHIMDAAYWALDLGYPDWIQPTSSGRIDACTFPTASQVTYHFPARGNMPEVVYHWYDGGLFPPRPSMIPADERPDMANGTYLIGEHGVIVVDEYGSSVRILPRSAFLELRTSIPPKTIRRVKSEHHVEFVEAIRENRPASSSFDYSGPFTEMVQLGNIALRAQAKLDFDAGKMQFTNHPEANSLINKEYPDGWII